MGKREFKHLQYLRLYWSPCQTTMTRTCTPQLIYNDTYQIRSRSKPSKDILRKEEIALIGDLQLQLRQSHHQSLNKDVMAQILPHLIDVSWKHSTAGIIMLLVSKVRPVSCFKQIQFIDARHQIWKLCDIDIWMKKPIYVLVYVFTMYVLYLSIEEVFAPSNCLDHDLGILDLKTWFVYCAGCMVNNDSYVRFRLWLCMLYIHRCVVPCSFSILYFSEF